MTYENELSMIKQIAFKNGITTDEWNKWMFESKTTINLIGFRNAAEVRRVALKNGKFVY